MTECMNIIDDAIAAKQFSGPALYKKLSPILIGDPKTHEALVHAWHGLGNKTAAYTTKGLIRAVFLIELVNERASSTKFERRWTPLLADDARGCSFEGCWEIFTGLAQKLAENATKFKSLLDRFRLFSNLPYELPIDYKKRRQGHVPGNLQWIWDDAEIERTLLLREHVRDRQVVGELADHFRLVGKKTAVKTYETDRALTGEHRTNREKRWETHPGSVQFAFRRDCLKIEHKLLSQICHFEGFPTDVRQTLTAKGVVLKMEQPAQCPITRDPLDFGLLLDSLEAPKAGRSAFQVGHLNPLKGPGAGSAFGHTPANVAWITKDGNRIQGDLSYVEVMALLERIRKNYTA